MLVTDQGATGPAPFDVSGTCGRAASVGLDVVLHGDFWSLVAESGPWAPFQDQDKQPGASLPGDLAPRPPTLEVFQAQMEALFTQPGISGGLPITNYLHVADYMISFCWQSCCGERVGSHINVVKSKGRSTLGDVNFDNAVFNTFNMPPLHHIDYAAFVRAWKKQGKQRMATLRKVSSETGDGGVDRSEVIRHHLSSGAGTRGHRCLHLRPE